MKSSYQAFDLKLPPPFIPSVLSTELSHLAVIYDWHSVVTPAPGHVGHQLPLSGPGVGGVGGGRELQYFSVVVVRTAIIVVTA